MEEDKKPEEPEVSNERKYHQLFLLFTIYIYVIRRNSMLTWRGRWSCLNAYEMCAWLREPYMFYYRYFDFTFFIRR